MKAAVALLSLAAVAFTARGARAQGACESAASTWVDRCAASRGIALEVLYCPPGRIVLHAPSGPLDVELSASADHAFSQVNGIGVSPVGEFPDWATEPDSKRGALRDVEACVAADPTVSSAFGSGGSRSRVIIPWRVLFALAGMLGMVAIAGRRASRVARRDAGIAVLLGVAAFALRAAVLPWAFLHQNGQGASWIDVALHDAAGFSQYGPGYAELYSIAARLGGAQPERGVLLWSALLGATVPSLVYAVARRYGAHPVASLAVSAVPLLDPILGRTFQSESYFAGITALTMASAALLAFLPARVRAHPLHAGVVIVASGLLLSQSVRIHPTAWPAVLLIPWVVVLGPGSWRQRATGLLVTLVGVGLVIGVSSGPAIAGVVHGSLGRQWLPHAMPRLSALDDRVVDTAMLAAVAGGASLRSWRGAVIAALGVAAISVARLTDLLADPNALVTAAQHRLELPVALCTSAAWLSRAARSPRRLRLWAPAFAGAALVSAVARFPVAVRLPTDALEARWAVEWRTRIEPTAAVATVERAGRRLLRLPLYSGLGPDRIALSAESSPSSFADLPEASYYYRSSLCSTAEGRSACERLEHTGRLELVEERELPARPSMRWLKYDTDRVRVALYRVIR
jgi:hypothetical protein